MKSYNEFITALQLINREREECIWRKSDCTFFFIIPSLLKVFFKGSGIFLGRIRVTNLLCHTSNTIQYLCETADIVTQKQAISFD